MDSLDSAADRLILCLEKAEADLKAVSRRLEDEFHQRYSGKGANPLSVLQRLQRLQRELPEVRKEFSAVQQAKQGLVKQVEKQLSANTGLLMDLEARAGMSPRKAAPADAESRTLELLQAAMHCGNAGSTL